ncbi:hypothetical protein [Filimonas effusa]|uniref:Uncharacterized protein n=1 Tax=Filimonas effusa TaxID=2508721 RepID=A0A4Q1D1G1_9BACT|nr:hypothetical protein [Filimonas effusa]RXK81698.1 hypothetical protein ESB13_18045 [Filimonas effusa]
MNNSETNFDVVIGHRDFKNSTETHHFGNMRDALLMLCEQDPTELFRLDASNPLQSYQEYFIADAGKKVVEMKFFEHGPKPYQEAPPSIYLSFPDGVAEFESKYQIPLNLLHGYGQSDLCLPTIHVLGAGVMSCPWGYMSGLSTLDVDQFNTNRKFAVTSVSLKAFKNESDLLFGKDFIVSSDTHHFPSLESATKHALQSNFDLMLHWGDDVEQIRNISISERVQWNGSFRDVEIARIAPKGSEIEFKIIDQKHLNARLDILETKGRTSATTIAVFDEVNSTYGPCINSERILQKVSDFQMKEWSAQGMKSRVLSSEPNDRRKGMRA